VGASLLVAVVVVALASPSCGGSDDTERPAPPAAPERSAGAPVQNAAARGFVAAVNSGSTDRVMATLTVDAVVIDSGRRFADTQAIRDWVDAELTGVDGRITVEGERPNAGGTVLTVDFRSSGFNGADLRYAFETRGDRIMRLTLGG
jgi:polyisoprenoid-binding protein YceI